MAETLTTTTDAEVSKVMQLAIDEARTALRDLSKDVSSRLQENSAVAHSDVAHSDVLETT
jgi:hypothetical protein